MFDGRQDLVGCLVPPERLGILVDGVDVLGDRPLQFAGRPVNPAPYLLVRQIGEEAFDLVEPRSGRWGEMNMPARTPDKAISDRLRLAGGAVVHDEVDLEVGRQVGLDVIQELAEFGGALALGCPSWPDRYGSCSPMGDPKSGSCGRARAISPVVDGQFSGSSTFRERDPRQWEPGLAARLPATEVLLQCVRPDSAPTILSAQLPHTVHEAPEEDGDPPQGRDRRIPPRVARRHGQRRLASVPGLAGNAAKQKRPGVALFSAISPQADVAHRSCIGTDRASAVGMVSTASCAREA